MMREGEEIELKEGKLAGGYCLVINWAPDTSK